MAVAGCVAQQEKDKLLKKVPYLDFVFGPDSIAKLPDIIGRVQGKAIGGGVGLAAASHVERVDPQAEPVGR